jgi:hypothetical protein
MSIEYVQTALHHVRFVLPEGGEGYYGGIRECEGVFANAQTLRACRDQLPKVLVGWVLLRVSRNQGIPTVDGPLPESWGNAPA